MSTLETNLEPHAAEATRQLFEANRRRIFGYCLSQLGNHHDAEDAVQTTFLYAFGCLERGVVPEAEVAWLYKIALNVCRTRRRSLGRRRRIEAPTDLDSCEYAIAAPERGDDELLGLSGALAAMPTNQRNALLLREWQGLSYAEIAERLTISQSAVETLLFRARRTLASRLRHMPQQVAMIANAPLLLQLGSPARSERGRDQDDGSSRCDRRCFHGGRTRARARSPRARTREGTNLATRADSCSLRTDVPPPRFAGPRLRQADLPTPASRGTLNRRGGRRSAHRIADDSHRRLGPHLRAGSRGSSPDGCDGADGRDSSGVTPTAGRSPHPDASDRAAGRHGRRAHRKRERDRDDDRSDGHCARPTRQLAGSDSPAPAAVSAGYRERAAFVGRAILAIGVVSAVFFIWQATGLPGVPGLDFGSSGAQADPALVVRAAAQPDPVRVHRAVVGATVRRPGGIKPFARSTTTPTRAPAPPTVPKDPAARTPAAPAAPGSPATPDVVGSPAVVPGATETEPVQVPAPPVVQTPPLPIPPALPIPPPGAIPSVLPPLPVAPALTVLPIPPLPGLTG